jgi:hypothetical protein
MRIKKKKSRVTGASGGGAVGGSNAALVIEF